MVKEDGEKALEGSCIDKADLFEYLGWENGMPRAECTPFYRWHISNLIIYDQPRKIGEFRRICHNDLYCESCAMYYTHNGNCEVMYILKGEITFIYDGKEETAYAGDVHYCPCNHTHTAENRTNEDAEFFAIVPETK